MKDLDVTKKYALAVSGGVDSMVMLHKFATLSPRPNFYVVTVNHGIRKQAEQDCQFVTDYCAKLGVPCRVVAVDVPTYCEQRKVSIETGARILRYQIFDGLDCDFVCTAHNANDNAETVLMHIIRGSGAKGASGIKRVNGKYLRPLLDMTRADIEQYATQHSVPSVTDETNADVKYTRNFIRHKVLPMLTELTPTAQQNILRFAESIAQDDEYLMSLADVSTVEFSERQAKVPVELLKQPAPIAYRVLSKVFNLLGVYHDMEKVHYDALLQLASNVGGKSVNLPFGLVAVNDYRFVTITASETQAPVSLEIPFGLGKMATPVGVVQVSNKELPNGLRFDLDAIPTNAVFRTRRQGDVFSKFGGGTKPLKRYLIDKKIPERKRSNLLLVASGNEILIVCGVEIADKLKVTENTKRIGYIKMQ